MVAKMSKLAVKDERIKTLEKKIRGLQKELRGLRYDNDNLNRRLSMLSSDTAKVEDTITDQDHAPEI